jgi:ribonuclease P protein component
VLPINQTKEKEKELTVFLCERGLLPDEKFWRDGEKKEGGAWLFSVPLISIKEKPYLRERNGLKIIIGKSVAKKAVERNRLRRRIRAIFRPLVKESGKNYVIIAHPGSAKASFAELKEEILKKLTDN